jgi:hypothetical protein
MARDRHISNTAPVLNALAGEQIHKAIAATSSALPKRFRGLALIIATDPAVAPHCCLYLE